MNFSIKGGECKLLHVNVRTETHGDKEVPAVDLKLQWETAQDVLVQFDPRLLQLLYGPAPATQEPVAGVEAVRPVQQFKELAPLHWKGEAQGLTLVLHHAMGQGQDLLLPACAADGFTISCLEGGTVRLQFRVRAVCQDERTLGKLPKLLHCLVPTSLLRVKEATANPGQRELQAV